MRTELTELEIKNFAHDVNNLLNRKNSEIAALNTENKRLKALFASVTESRVLTVEEIVSAGRGVWVEHLRYVGKGFYAIPSHDGNGVISGRKGLYRYKDYGETWQAYSERPVSCGEAASETTAIPRGEASEAV